MIDKVYDYMKKTGMLEDTKTIIAGLSGGADSVCLVTALKKITELYKLDIKIAAVHVNHGIRGEEAERDEEFARNFALKNGIEFYSYHVDIPKLSKESGMSEEEAGRHERYRLFRLTAQKLGGARIAVAHHMDDQAETVLMRIMRGTGIAGITGMSPVNNDIIRPLLCVTRSEIEEYLKKQGQDYITDSTNLDDNYTRNKIRNVLLPVMRESFNPNITGALCALSEDAARTEAHLEKETDDAVSKYVSYKENFEEAVISPLSEFLKLDLCIRERVYRKVLFRCSGQYKNIYRVNIDAADRIARGETGKSYDMPWSVCVKKIYDRLIFTKTNTKANGITGCIGENEVFDVAVDINEISQSESKRYKIEKNIYMDGKTVYLKSIDFQILNNLNGKFSGNDYTKYFDYDKIKNTIHLRFRQNGDYLVFSADGAVKKLKKELIDKKIEPHDREKVLIAALDSEVLWAVGVRRCQSYLVDNATKNILEIRLNIQEDNRDGKAQYQCSYIGRRSTEESS